MIVKIRLLKAAKLLLPQTTIAPTERRRGDWVDTSAADHLGQQAETPHPLSQIERSEILQVKSPKP